MDSPAVGRLVATRDSSIVKQQAAALTVEWMFAVQLCLFVPEHRNLGKQGLQIMCRGTGCHHIASFFLSVPDELLYCSGSIPIKRR